MTSAHRDVDPLSPITIGTRGSDLALWQARHVQALLGGPDAGVQLRIIKTSGDRFLDIALQNQLDKGFFTKELEAELLTGGIDLAVHSLKDLPTENPPELVLGAVPPRADTGDVLFVQPDAHDPSAPMGLRPGARVGTASLRRMALLRAHAPQVHSELLRGNVPTRLGKAKDGVLDAVVLARAGVSRLGLDWGALLAFDLDPTVWLPAAGQGALGLQCRAADTGLRARLDRIADPIAALAVRCERDVLRRLEGGCHSPFGALATVQAATVTLRAGAAAADDRWVAVQVTAPAEAVAAQTETALRAALVAPATSRAEAAWVQPARPWC
ncbi:MAG: hydroxymethylbilane synthase [Deltaproteobacteria bacterium]|nr:hydroxymethylbilane synthase [Deltaproteobacteria bacterium]